MCTRYITLDQSAVERAWEISRRNHPKWANEVLPRSLGPFLRVGDTGLELGVGTRGLVPTWSKTAKLTDSTQNCRSEEATR